MTTEQPLTRSAKKLQAMYDDANWWGYTNYKGVRVYTYYIILWSTSLGITLTYNCPA